MRLSVNLCTIACSWFLVLSLITIVEPFLLHGTRAISRTELQANPFRAIRNLLRKPNISANFPVNGKKVKISAEKSKELSQKYEEIDDIGEKAYQVVMDLELVDMKWRKYERKRGKMMK